MGDVAFVPVGTHALPLSAAVGLPQRTACAGRSNQLAPAHLRRFVSGQEQQIFFPDLPSTGFFLGSTAATGAELPVDCSFPILRVFAEGRTHFENREREAGFFALKRRI